MDYSARIEARDNSVFSILTAMSGDDKRSFLEVQNVIRSYDPSYTYLEVVSDLGGSLIAPLLDRCCVRALSIDSRPGSQPDERGRHFDFPDNSAERMRSELRNAGVSEAALSSLVTFDADASSVTLAHAQARFAFIDAEHTNRAVFRDFLNVRRFMIPSHVVMFHDANLIFDGLLNIEEMLHHEGANFTAIYAPDTMFVVAVGALVEPIKAAFRGRQMDREEFVARSRRALSIEIARSTERLSSYG